MKLGQVLIFAKDLGKLHAFYRDALGLPTVDDVQADDVIRLDAGGALIALHAVPAAHAVSIVIDDPPKPRANTPVKMIFHVDDVRAARARLAEHGAAMRELSEVGDRLSFDCLDPEGNVFRVANR